MHCCRIGHFRHAWALRYTVMAMLLRDPRLSLTTNGYVDELSKVVQSDTISEGLYTSFVAYLNGVAARELPSFKVAAAKPKARPVKKVAAAKSTGR